MAVAGFQARPSETLVDFSGFSCCAPKLRASGSLAGSRADVCRAVPSALKFRVAKRKPVCTRAGARKLFDSEPPPFNRRYLESRLAYRIQELAYGGLKPETVRRLERLGEELDGGDRKKRGMRADRDRPITGTRLLREWQGVEQVVTVTADGFEWQGRPYKSLSAIARAITGTRWNGWVFFGLRNHRGRT